MTDSEFYFVVNGREYHEKKKHRKLKKIKRGIEYIGVGFIAIGAAIFDPDNFELITSAAAAILEIASA